MSKIGLSFFSCEAQLNTCTCAWVCLYVCLSVSKLNFSLFGPYLTAYDSLRQLTTAYNSWWQIMTADNNFWQLLTVFDSFWQFLKVSDSFWKLMTLVHDTFHFSPKYDCSLHQEQSLKSSWMIGEDLRRNTLAWYTCPDSLFSSELRLYHCT